MTELITLFQELILHSELAQLWVILLVVIVVTWFISWLKQPLIIGYLLAGVLVWPLAFGLVQWSTDWHTFIELFSHLWISLLLFMVWVGLNVNVVKEQGKVSLWIGFFQMILTFGVGLWFSSLLGYDFMTSVFVGIALTFSSTIVIVKLLSDREEDQTLYGKVSIWVLIVQDLVVMLLFMLLAFYGWGEWWWVMVLEGLLLIVLTVLFSKYLLPALVRRLSRSEELLLLVWIWRCLILWTMFELVWFSFEIGCLLAWMSFANSPFRMFITAKLKALRDFFLVLFFIAMGLELHWAWLANHVWLLVGSLILVMFLKPLFIYLASTWFGYTHQVSFKSAASLGQISEFGFIVLWIALGLGYVGDESLMSVMVLVWLVSIAVSSYCTMNNNKIFTKLEKFLGKEHVKSTEEVLSEALRQVEVILFGYWRIWSALSKKFDEQRVQHIVIDHNPELIDTLESKNGEYIFADATSIEVYHHLFHPWLRMVVTTIRDLEDDLYVVKHVHEYNPDIIIVVVSNYTTHALELYEAGADYVIMPDALWAKHTTNLFDQIGFDRDFFLEQKLSHIEDLESKKQKGN